MTAGLPVTVALTEPEHPRRGPLLGSERGTLGGRAAEVELRCDGLAIHLSAEPGRPGRRLELAFADLFRGVAAALAQEEADQDAALVRRARG